MIIVCDVETTGYKHWWHDCLSVGLVALDENLNQISTFYGTCKPWQPDNFNHDTVKAHGFTLAEAMTFQDCRELCIQILNFLKPFYRPGHYFTFVAHQNGLFDYAFMQSLFIKGGLQFSFYKVFNQYHIESTIKMGRDAGYDKNGLSEWAPRLGHTFNHHNALEDAILCAKIYRFLKEQKNVLLESDSQQESRIHREGKRKTKLSNDSAGESSQLAIV